MQRELGCKAQVLKEEKDFFYKEGVPGRMISFTGTIDNCLKFIRFFNSFFGEPPEQATD